MATLSLCPILSDRKIFNRWVQMIAGIIAMMAIANLQYAWTLFTKPLTSSLHTTLTAVQVAFAAFIFCETWLVPFEGYLIDRLGPRLVIGIGGLLVGAGWIGSGYVTTVTGLYIWYAMAVQLFAEGAATPEHGSLRFTKEVMKKVENSVSGAGSHNQAKILLEACHGQREKSACYQGLQGQRRSGSPVVRESIDEAEARK